MFQVTDDERKRMLAFAREFVALGLVGTKREAMAAMLARNTNPATRAKVDRWLWAWAAAVAPTLARAA